MMCGGWNINLSLGMRELDANLICPPAFSASIWNLQDSSSVRTDDILLVLDWNIYGYFSLGETHVFNYILFKT